MPGLANTREIEERLFLDQGGLPSRMGWIGFGQTAMGGLGRKRVLVGSRRFAAI